MRSCTNGACVCTVEVCPDVRDELMNNVLVAFFLITSAVAAPVVAQEPVAADVPRQAEGAEKVVVATVGALNATFETNAFGGRLIISQRSGKCARTAVCDFV